MGGGMPEALTQPLPPLALFVLRHLLFLGPLALCVWLFQLRRGDRRLLVGAVFAFLYGLPMVFVGHVVAGHLGLWTYGGTTLQVLGVPVDIWMGGALLWGPVAFLAAPASPQWRAPAAFIVINGLTLPMLTPFVNPGPHWFLGVIGVFLMAHLPALYLAQWTWRQIHLPRRALLLACAFAPLAFFLIPTLIMHALGGEWAVLAERPVWVLALAVMALAAVATLGWSSVQMFVLYGEGTPIPLDPTQRLVTSGVYAYVCNPMQLSTALGFLVLGWLLWNPWVLGGAGMAVAFVLGMVRWHHRHDLERRFPVDWPRYRSQVPEWFPRWKPWQPVSDRATLTFDARCSVQHAAVAVLQALQPVGLVCEGVPGARVRYRDQRSFTGCAAWAMALTRANFAAMMVGSAALLILLPVRGLMPNQDREAD